MNRAELQKIQEEYTRKIFNEEFEIISPILTKYLKCIDIDKYRSEVYGRRILISNEISDRFKVSLKIYFKNDSFSSKDFVEDECLSLFFNSSFFIKSKYGLPAVEGIGNGYENISKFYFWALENVTNKDFIEMLQLEMSVYLIMQNESSLDTYFKRFSNGILVKNGLNTFFVTSDCDVFELNDQVDIDNIKSMNIFKIEDLLNVEQC